MKLKIKNINVLFLILIGLIGISVFIFITNNFQLIKNEIINQIEYLQINYNFFDKPQPTIKSDQNFLIIESINISSQIYEGEDEKTLKHGIWRLPWTSSPENNSNTVIVGHRLTFNAKQNIFYNLHKLQVNDKILINWENQEYNYKITEIKTVLPSAIEVENPTIEPTLTLYTCTPIFTSEKRLVVTAELI